MLIKGDKTLTSTNVKIRFKSIAETEFNGQKIFSEKGIC